MAVQHQSKTQTVSHAQHFVEVLPTEAQLIGDDTNIRLHHGRTHDIAEALVFQLLPETAQRTALLFVKGLINGDGIKLFSHRKPPFRLRQS